MRDGDLLGPEDRIFGIVRRTFRANTATTQLRSEQSLQDAGLTSLDMVTLMLAVEAEFNLEIPQQEMTPENFRSVATIGRLVTSLTAPV